MLLDLWFHHTYAGCIQYYNGGASYEQPVWYDAPNNVNGELEYEATTTYEGLCSDYRPPVPVPTYEWMVTIIRRRIMR